MKRKVRVPYTEIEAAEKLGRVTFYLADAYPFIKDDVYLETPERRACEIILSLKDLLTYMNWRKF